MKIIQRHYTKEFFKLLGIIALGLALIFSISDLIGKIDDFMPARPSICKLISYTLLNLPKYLLYLQPVALLISSLFIFSQASRNKELVAIRAAGGRLKALFYPFIISGILLSVFAFIIGEVIIPDFSKRSDELIATLKKKDERTIFKEGALWLKGTDGSLVRIELYIVEKRLARGVSIFISEGDLLTKRIEAEEAEWVEAQNSRSKKQGSESVWRLKKVTVYDIQGENISHIPEMDCPYLEPPDFFTEGIKKPEEMGIGELYRYAKRLEEAGFRNTKLIVDLNSRCSYPLANFFMILLGISLSLRSQVGGGLFAAGLGLFISLIYWLGYTLMLSMGYAGIAPPLLSVWAMPLLFGTAAVYLFRKIPE